MIPACSEETVWESLLPGLTGQMQSLLRHCQYLEIELICSQAGLEQVLHGEGEGIKGVWAGKFHEHLQCLADSRACQPAQGW